MRSLLLGMLAALTTSLGGILRTIGLISFVVLCPFLNLWSVNLFFGAVFPYDVAHWLASFWFQCIVLTLAMYLKPNVTIHNFGPVSKGQE